MDEFKLYTILEMVYERHFKNMGVLEEVLYPLDWYDIKNYQVKIEVLRESLKTDTLIINTVYYQKIKGNDLILRREYEE